MATHIDALHSKKKRKEAEETLTKFYHSHRRNKFDFTCRGLISIREEKDATPKFKMIEWRMGNFYMLPKGIHGHQDKDICHKILCHIFKIGLLVHINNMQPPPWANT